MPLGDDELNSIWFGGRDDGSGGEGKQVELPDALANIGFKVDIFFLLFFSD